MGRGKLLGGDPVGTVALVDAPVSQWYARRAGVTGLVVGVAVDALVTAVLSVFHPLVLAVVFGALAGIVSAFAAATLVRIWPVLRVLWWWAIEIAAAVFVVGGWVTVAHLATWWVALAALLLVTASCVVPRRVRRFLAAWSWCLAVRHRLRSCFAGIVRGTGATRPGSLPLVMWARPTLAGARVWLWLRPGLELADLDGKTGRIAVACWAKEVRVVGASERYAALIRVDITRRDPLRGLVDSPLALLIPALRRSADAVTPVSPAVSLVGLELADIEDPAPEPSRGGRR